MDRVVFADLAGSDRPLDPSELRWIAELAPTLNEPQALSVAASRAAGDPDPVLVPQLDGTWQAGRYIGELQRDGRVLEIRPRLPVQTIAAWAGAIFGVRVIPDAATLHGTSALIAQLIAATWRSALLAAARDTLPGIRQRQPYTGSFARGQLDVAKTAKLRAARQPLVSSVQRPRQLNNPATRAIVLADAALTRRLGTTTWRNPRATEILAQLRGATGARPRLPTQKELASVRYTPITEPYRRVAELSWQIVRGRGLHAAATAEQDGALLLDVAELWELFLLHCARRAFGAANVTHGTTLNVARSLLHSPATGRTLGRLYPDIIIGPLPHPWLIIDAKYKPLNDRRGVDREDLYQLHAYTTAFASTTPPRGVLAYPILNADDPAPIAEAAGPWHSGQPAQLEFLRFPVTETECTDALLALASPDRPTAAV